MGLGSIFRNFCKQTFRVFDSEAQTASRAAKFRIFYAAVSAGFLSLFFRLAWLEWSFFTRSSLTFFFGSSGERKSGKKFHSFIDLITKKGLLPVVIIIFHRLLLHQPLIDHTEATNKSGSSHSTHPHRVSSYQHAVLLASVRLYQSSLHLNFSSPDFPRWYQHSLYWLTICKSSRCTNTGIEQPREQFVIFWRILYSASIAFECAIW